MNLFTTKLRLEDKNNTQIKLIKTNGEIEFIDEIRGIKFNFLGSNNEVTIYEGTTFVNCHMNLISNMKIEIKKSKFNITNLRIYGRESQIRIGENFSCWGVEVRCHEPKSMVNIGNNCMFAENILIYPTDVHTIYDLFTKEVLNLAKPISIGDWVWIARDVKLLKGTVIRNECVVGIGSLVNKAFNENNVIIAGNHAHIIRRGIMWDRKTPYEYSKQLNSNL